MAVFTVIILGTFSGITWATGFTMLGMEVKDEVRGRTFAFVQSLIRITLVAVLAVAPVIAAAFGVRTYELENSTINFSGAQATILAVPIGKSWQSVEFDLDRKSALQQRLDIGSLRRQGAHLSKHLCEPDQSMPKQLVYLQMM